MCEIALQLQPLEIYLLGVQQLLQTMIGFHSDFLKKGTLYTTYILF